jgi:carboxyl-terminal processing protease
MKVFLKIVLLSISFWANGQSPALRVPDSLQNYMDTVLNIVQARSLYSKRVDWAVIRDSTNRLVTNAKNIQDLMPAVEYIFTAIGDYHGGLSYKGQRYGMKAKEITVRDDLALGWKIGPKVRIEVLESSIAYISIPPIWALTVEETTKYAQQIQDSVCKLNRVGIRGWIIDLRFNLGGNMYAMIGGLGNLIGDGVLGSFVEANGMTTDFSLRQGDVFEGTKRWTTLQAKCKVAARPKIAVLLSQITSSSGEMLAISFKGRPLTRFFGENTAGYVTANDDPYFIDKNSMLLVASANVTDRNHKFYMEFVQPDVIIVEGDNFEDLKGDKKIKASLEWLKSD